MSNKSQIINIFVENWTSVYNTLLGRDVRISIDSVEKKKPDDLCEIFSSFQSFISVSYGDHESQRFVMALQNRLVSIISNLMIGLDTFKDEINTDDRDAFKEAVNQMFSACQAPIKDSFNLDMKFRKIKFVKPGEAEVMMEEINLEAWNCTVYIPGLPKEQFLMITPREFGSVKKRKSSGAPIKAPIEPSELVPQPSTAPAAAKYNYSGSNIDLLLDIELPITVRIGTTEMRLIDILRLGLGSIIELEKCIDDPVEVLVNEKLVARGEVVVTNSNFAIRITEVQSKAERIKSLA